MSDRDDPSALLRIYLNDHRAGAAAGVALANRSARNNRGTPFEEPLRSLASDIATDASTLDGLMEELDVPVNEVKRGLMLVGERLARFKLNGRIVGYSPLSRVLEIEGLIAGVEGKRALWLSLQEIEEVVPAAIDTAALRDRAEDQLRRLHDLHSRARSAAFRDVASRRMPGSAEGY